MRRPFIHLLLLAAAGWAGCSSDRGQFENKPGDLGSPDAGLDSVDAGCSGLVCSRDLRSVRDCYGNLVKECGADTACGKGECIAPCDAAAVNEGSVGCSFAIPAQNGGLSYRGDCAAFFVANNWTSPATIHVEFKGEELSLDGAVWVPSVEDGVVKHRKLDGPIPAGEAAVVFLSNERRDDRDWIACPDGVRTVLEREDTVARTGIGHAVFARADVPVSMYSIYPYGGANGFLPSASLLFPTTSFRNNYIAVSAWGGKSDTFVLPARTGPGIGQVGKPTLQIVAAEDDTSIDLLPRVDLIGGNGIQSSRQNEVVRHTLRRGEVMQITQERELVGSVIETNKPVGLFGGATCVNIPYNTAACDIDNEQIPPLSSWGREYAVLPAPNRASWLSQKKGGAQDLGIIRMVGAVNGTKLVYEPWTPEGAPDELQSGQLVRFATDRPFVVRSQDSGHPFYVASVMSGVELSSSGLGDPETALTIPTDQWLDSYVFFSDFTYALSGVFVTRRKTNGEFRDVTLECAGVLTDWQPINADYEWTYAELSRFGKPVPYPAGTCTDGVNRIRSDGPFSMTVWGLGRASSYAYPGGAGLRPITDVHVPAVVR